MSEYKYKICTKCGELYPRTTDFFLKHKRTADRLRPECKYCRAGQIRRWRKKYPDKNKSFIKKYAIKRKMRDTSLARRRFLKGEGVRYLKNGKVRCHAVSRGKLQALRQLHPELEAKDAWPIAQCGLPALPGQYVCHYHSVGNAPARSMERFMAKPSEYMAGDLLEKYVSFKADPELLDQRHNIALLSARNAELLQDIAHQSTLSKNQLRIIDDAIKDISHGNIDEGLEKLKKVRFEAEQEREVWDEIRKNTDSIKNLSKTEIDRVKEMRLSISQDQMMRIIDSLSNGFLRAVETADIEPSAKKMILKQAVTHTQSVLGTPGSDLMQLLEGGSE